MSGSDESSLAEGQYRACQVVAGFIAQVALPVVDRAMQVTPNSHASTAHAYLLRVLCWCRTLGKLNHASDFQAAAACVRSMLEMAIDLTLLKHDPNNPPQKLLDWELSAKFKASFSKMSAVQKQPAEHASGLDMLYASFIVDRRDDVQRVRDQWWKGKHPQRWTGRTLPVDAKECDRLTSSQHVMYYDLTRPSAGTRTAAASWRFVG